MEFGPAIFEKKYKTPAINPKDEEIFREILKPKNWDFKMFKSALIVSGKLNAYPFNTPDSIHLGALRRSIDVIKEKTLKTGNEYSKGFFVDLTENKLIGGKTTEGDDHSCYANWDKPENDHELKHSILLHSHPTVYAGVHLSPRDYITFLNDPELVSMMMTCSGTELMALKTFQTPNNFNQNSLEKSINALLAEFLGKNPKIPDIIRYQKAVCLENALSLYIATSSNKDLAKKVDLFDDEKIYS
ncbi:MAG TPA: hypothetical protein DDY52_03470 [Candidatus Moranbacteria bacterium]|nr:MAG: hypothetical protein UR51_C0010G0045 [Candidatus Moranbacteria bacterium GW2011_GWF1_34_10]HBI17181.1 hypothetical protein [Candidatus Moranbacteria bacterium]